MYSYIQEEVSEATMGSDTSPVVKSQVMDEGVSSTAGGEGVVYCHSPLLSLAQAAAVVNMDEE